MRAYAASRGIRAGLALCLAALCAACAEVNYLRDAQDTFSETAATENALRYRIHDPGSAAGAPASVRSGYASVIHSLNSLDEQQIGKLEGDGLYAPVLVLKSMSYWRLGDDDKALATAKEAQALGAGELGPRDEALMAAMPGLVRNDQAARKLQALAGADPSEREARVRSIVGLLNSADQDIAKARAGAPPDHDVQLYLVQVQLAADKNLNDACVAYAIAADGSFDLAKDDQCKGRAAPAGEPAWGSSPRFECRASAHMRDFQELAARSPQSTRAMEAWEQAIGIPPDAEPVGC